MRVSRAALAIITEDTQRINRQRIQYLGAVVDGVRREVTYALGPDPFPGVAERVMGAVLDAAIDAILDLSDAEISQAISSAEEEAYLQRLAAENAKEESNNEGN